MDTSKQEKPMSDDPRSGSGLRPTRRNLTTGVAWLAPAVVLGTSAPANAASSITCAGCKPCAMGGGSGALAYWTTGTGTTATWVKCGVTVTFTMTMVAGSAIGTNGTISTTATGLAGGAGIGDSSTMNGLVLNMQGTSTVNPLQRVDITFSQAVCNFSMYMRDVSWYSNTTGASDRDALYWSRTPTSVTSYVGTGSPRGTITGTGAAGTPVERSTCCGTVPSGNGYYYDLQANWSPSMKTLSMYYTNGTGPSTDQMYLQIRDLSFCYQ